MIIVTGRAGNLSLKINRTAALILYFSIYFYIFHFLLIHLLICLFTYSFVNSFIHHLFIYPFFIHSFFHSFSIVLIFVRCALLFLFLFCVFPSFLWGGDVNPSIFYFFEVLQIAWDHAHWSQLVLLICLVVSRALYDQKMGQTWPFYIRIEFLSQCCILLLDIYPGHKSPTLKSDDFKGKGTTQ